MRKIFTKEKIKKYSINILYFIIFIVILLILVVFIVKLFNIILKEYFNISSNINNADIIGILSLNVGILQAILGFGAIVAALLVFINFNSTKEKLEKMDANVMEMRRIVDRHDKQIKEGFEKDSKRDVPNIDTSNDNTSEEVNNL